jgi:NAD-dependent DNA ligase
MGVTVSELRKITDKRQAKKVIRGLGADTSIAVLTKLNECYRDGKPAVSDSVYDLLYDAALELFPDDAFFGKVGGGSRADDQKLQYYMSSRSKFKDASWNLISNWVGKHSILIAAKKDGIALQLHYQGGRIVSAATQGKTGYTGKSVLHLILHCPNVPQTIATKADVFIRCEGIFPKSVSNEVLGITEGRGGRRNIAAGVLNRTQANSDTKAKMQHIDIIALQIFGSKKKLPDQYAALHAAGFKVPPYKVLEANELNADRLHRMLVNLKKTNYDCDGLVLTYADISLPVETSGNPDWSMAYKESDATTQVVAEVTDVVWNVGKTGKIAPTIKTKPVRLGDITASSFTGFSGTFILTGKRLAEGPGKAKPIGVGAKVLVERAAKTCKRRRRDVSQPNRLRFDCRCDLSGFADIPNDVRYFGDNLRSRITFFVRHTPVRIPGCFYRKRNVCVGQYKTVAVVVGFLQVDQHTVQPVSVKFVSFENLIRRNLEASGV